MGFNLAAFAAAAAVALSAVTPVWAQDKPLTVKVFTAGERGLNANATIISGEKEAVLVDAPFTRADAFRLAAEILDNGKPLKAIIVTHAHPDHYFGLTELREIFPQAQIIAQPQVAHAVLEAFPRRFAFWGPQIGLNAPRYPTAPSEYAKDVYELEGQEIRLIGPMRGDAPLSTVVWVPSARAAIVGDITVNEGGLYLVGTDKAARADWIASLDRILALKPTMVVPGHMHAGTPTDLRSVDFTRNHLAQFEAIVDASTSVDDFKARYLAAFPGTGEGFSFNDMAETVMKAKAAGK